MKIEQSHIEQIKADFEKMQTKEDFLNLLNKVKPLIYGEKTVPFELKQITWYSNTKVNTKRYKEFSIKKKSGKERIIHAPVKGLKSIQKTLNLILQCVFEPHAAAYGFVNGKSIVDNAKIHVGQRFVYNIDLKDFFPSIDQARVWKCLQLKPFNLFNSSDTTEVSLHKPKIKVKQFTTEFGETIFYKFENNRLILIIDRKGNFEKYKERLTKHITRPIIGPHFFSRELLEYDKEIKKAISEYLKRHIGSSLNLNQSNQFETRSNIASIISNLCCTEMIVERKNENGDWEMKSKNVLPQGAPTSPLITNIICQRLDYLLSAVAKRFGLIYSRYADDITFSSMHNVYQLESDFIKELDRIITEQGFHIKESKTRLQKDGYRKEVTGLLVNEKANVQQRYIKQLRMWLYYWERYEYERAAEFFVKDYSNTNLVNGQARLENQRMDRWNAKEFKFSNEYKEKRPINMVKIIRGKLNYLRMVKGVESDLYQKLKNRFDILIGNVNFDSNRENHLKVVLQIFEEKGLDNAMDYFKP